MTAVDSLEGVRIVANQVKVLLVEDVYKLGYVGDVVNVRPGYARNYLLPQRLAVIPTRQNLKRIEEAKIKASELRRIRLAKRNELADKIRGMKIVIEAKVNESGRLFGSVGKRDILQSIAKALGAAEITDLDLPVDCVTLHESIREPITDLAVKLDLEHDITAEVLVSVVPTADSEKAEPPAAGTGEQPPSAETNPA
jgi:large subunit ribosomal protein L9